MNPVRVALLAMLLAVACTPVFAAAAMSTRPWLLRLARVGEFIVAGCVLVIVAVLAWVIIAPDNVGFYP